MQDNCEGYEDQGLKWFILFSSYTNVLIIDQMSLVCSEGYKDQGLKWFKLFSSYIDQMSLICNILKLHIS